MDCRLQKIIRVTAGKLNNNVRCAVRRPDTMEISGRRMHPIYSDHNLFTHDSIPRRYDGLLAFE
jgi:hypothetical protein